ASRARLGPGPARPTDLPDLVPAARPGLAPAELRTRPEAGRQPGAPPAQAPAGPGPMDPAEGPPPPLGRASPVRTRAPAEGRPARLPPPVARPGRGGGPGRG